MTEIEMTLKQKLTLYALTDDWQDVDPGASKDLGDIRAEHPDLLESRSGHHGPDETWVHQWRLKPKVD